VINLLVIGAASRGLRHHADAAIALLTDAAKPTGRALIDVDVLARRRDRPFRLWRHRQPELDFFVDRTEPPAHGTAAGSTPAVQHERSDGYLCYLWRTPRDRSRASSAFHAVSSRASPSHLPRAPAPARGTCRVRQSPSTGKGPDLPKPVAGQDLILRPLVMSQDALFNPARQL